MCGIAGIIQTNSSEFSLSHLKKMTDSLAHRGPDGEGHWQNDSSDVLLGHRRLSIIDLTDAGTQPMHYLNRYTIIHNGEIYNYIELRETLIKKGYTFNSKTDTEVIAAAYHCWEDDCIDFFDGMFAFAIWDEEKKILFAARDRFGEKPFYYSFNNNQFLFASEMKALWAAGIERKPNLKMLFNFITIGYTGNPEKAEETFFENIYKLPSSCRLYYDHRMNELTIEKYWEIDSEDINKKITDAEAFEKFNRLFQISIQRRLRSDVAVGSSLSGGLDSSSIIAEASRFMAQGSPISSFTAVFSGFEKNESVFAKQIAEKFSLQHFTAEIKEENLIRDFEKICFHQEEPFGSASVLAQYRVYDLAKQHNIKVLLDGQGADETLAGYHKYYKWYWQELFRKMKLTRSGELKAASENGVQEKFGFKNAIAAWIPDFASIVLEKQYLLHALRQEDLTKEFVRLQSKEAYYTRPSYYNLNSALHFNTFTNGLEELLRYADRNSMAHGREVRLPFLSHELVEFIFTLPANFKIRNGWTKWILRESMKEKLPDEIAWRKDKIGFEPPQKKWMEHKALHQLIMDAKSKLVKEKILKPEVLNKKIQPHDAHAAESFDWRYLTAGSYLT